MLAVSSLGRVSTVVVLCALVCSCGGGGGSAGSPGSGTPADPPPAQTESTPTKFSDSPAYIRGLAKQGDGSTVVVREVPGLDPNRVVLSKLDANGKFVGDIEVASKPAPVGDTSRQSLYKATVAADGIGNTFVAWFDYIPNANNSNEPRRLHVRRIVQGVLQDEQQFSATGSGLLSSYQLAVAPDGSALLAWPESPPPDPVTGIWDTASIYTASYTPASGWSVITKLGTPDPLYATNVTLATRNGKSVAMYDQGDDLMATTRNVDGSWSTPRSIRTMADGAQELQKLQAAIDAAGNIMVMWRIRFNQGQEIGYNRFDATSGQWLGADYLVREDSDDQTPTLVMNTAGAGMVAWREGWNTVVAHFDRTGWTAGHILSTQDPYWAFGAYPFVAIDEDGNAIATWDQAYSGPSQLSLQHHALRMSRYTPATGWSAAKNLGTLDAVQLNLGLSGVVGGKVVAIWAQGDIGTNREAYWASQLDLLAPAGLASTGTIAQAASSVRVRPWNQRR